MAQAGNAWEWMETAVDGINDAAGELRVIRGGGWDSPDSQDLDASHYSQLDPVGAGYLRGFRVAIVGVPEPSALSLLTIGLSGLAMIRRRKK
jgi:formylglycine-generating enzyme required for sulfatase activity